nr:MAG TPA: homing endonuclease [Bacteriophage sp.]
MPELMWKKVTYPGVRSNMYLVSENGDVKNIMTNHILSPYTDKDGYLKICLISDQGKHGKQNVFIHRLVAWEYVPNPNKYPVVDHLDGNKLHNHYSNFEWVTVRENTLRAERMGLRNVRGENNRNSKWTEEFVRSICEKFQDGWSIKDVYRWAVKDPNAQYDKSNPYYTLIYRLKKKELWPDIVNEYDYDTSSKKTESWKEPVPQSSNYVYSEEIIRQVCQYLEDGKTYLEICKLMGQNCSKESKFYTFIQGIRCGRNWKNISKYYTFRFSNTDRDYGCLKEIADMIDEGYTNKEIRNYYHIFHKETKEGQAINRMIDRYKRAKRLGKSITIYERKDSPVNLWGATE